MNKLELIPVEYHKQRVLTTAQIADAYGTTEKIISKNFNNNKERYIEGVHYFRLTGDEIKAFFAFVNFTNANSNKIRTLYLWTERGALLHAKSLNTDKAWEVYEFLVDNYFRTRNIYEFSNNALIQIIENKINSFDKRLDNLEKKCDNIINFDKHIIIPFIKGIIKRFK